MATGIKASRIALLAFAIIAMAVLALYASSLNSRLPALPDSCVPLPANIKEVGPPLSISQVEALSLAEITDAAPGVSRVPFGHLNSEWVALKQLARPGDTVHEFRADISGGHLVLRQKCLVGQLPTWIR